MLRTGTCKSLMQHTDIFEVYPLSSHRFNYGTDMDWYWRWWVKALHPGFGDSL